MTLRSFQDGLYRIGTILGDGRKGEFVVNFSADLRLHNLAYDVPTITYTPIEREAPIDIEPGGARIATAISLHILDLIDGKAKSYLSTPQEKTLNEIVEKYPHAIKIITGA